MKKPWQEYPRPMMERTRWKNLNGEWDYSFGHGSAFPREYEGRILVPFSPEAERSGVNRQLKPGETLFYRKSFFLKKDFVEDRVLLHFGAVDQRCMVYVNDEYVGGHIGGYLPFSLDVTGQIRVGHNEIRVAVWDMTEMSYHARGKQKLGRGGMFYTAQSGIWQTVWLEPVPEQYIKKIRITPDYDRSMVEIRIFTNQIKQAMSKVKYKIFYQGQMMLKATGCSDQTVRIAIPDLHPWTPRTPNLYDIQIAMGDDTITSYFAMRKFSVANDGRGIRRFFLNNKPFFHNGLLDQGYWPEGLYTAPDDASLIADIENAKRLGFTMLRKHAKIEPQRWYYHCDRLGMLVWQDMVNGGGRYHMGFVCMLINIHPAIGRLMADNKYGILARRDEAGRREFIHETHDTMEALYNHPCIAVWVPFNEGWGQFDAQRITYMMRRWDPTRQIDQASGWFDQKGGDVYSIHNYFRKVKIRPHSRVVALSEFGGICYRDPEHTQWKKTYGYAYCASPDSLSRAYQRLFEGEVIRRIRCGLSATVYTQLSDVEEEVNGLYTYDREVLKIDEHIIRICNLEVEAVFDHIVEKKKEE